MKKVIKASIAKVEAESQLNKVLRAAQQLLDVMDATSEDLIEKNDLSDLYDCLIEDIPALTLMLRRGDIEV